MLCYEAGHSIFLSSFCPGERRKEVWAKEPHPRQNCFSNRQRISSCPSWSSQKLLLEKKKLHDFLKPSFTKVWIRRELLLKDNWSGEEALCDNLEISARCGCDWEEQKDGEVMVPQISLFKKIIPKGLFNFIGNYYS